MSRHGPRHEALVSQGTKSRGALVLGLLLTNSFAKEVDECQVTHITCPLNRKLPRRTVVGVAARGKMVQRLANFLQRVIPGRRSEAEASPESILPDLRLWIPGSRPAAEPRNDSCCGTPGVTDLPCAKITTCSFCVSGITLPSWRQSQSARTIRAHARSRSLRARSMPGLS